MHMYILVHRRARRHMPSLGHGKELVNKISASELSRKFIEGPLLVGLSTATLVTVVRWGGD